MSTENDQQQQDSRDANLPEADGTEAVPPEGRLVTLGFAEYEELKTLAAERDEYLKRLRHAVADGVNLQNRMGKLRAASQAEALRNVGRKVAPLADSLRRALDAAEQMSGAGQIAEGLQIVEKEFYAILSSLGIEPIHVVGEPFDPHFHEAVFQKPVEGVAPGMVVEELQKGFLLGKDLLRPAKVVVSGPAPGDGAAQQ